MKDLYKDRKWVMQGFVLLVGLIFLGTLFHLQVVNPKYKDLAEKNVIKRIKMYPTRGLIYDRNDNLLVFNQAIYDIHVIPRQVKDDIDTALFCELLSISKEDFIQKMEKVSSGLKYYSSNEFIKQVAAEDYAKFHEYGHLFEGFYGEPRTIRKYPFKVAAHILGDVGEVDSSQIVSSDYYYKPGDYVGKSGLELNYEQTLRGERGFRYVFIDKFYNEQGSYDEGKSDSLPVAGENIELTIDINLQAYGEKLMQNKKGSIVAIEPSTGEILALVTSPNFDPNLLCGAERGDNYKDLLQDTLSPLFNRAIMAEYPPGSTFKPLVALIAMQENAIHKNYSYYCDRTYSIPGYTLSCSHGHPSAKNVMQGIQHSCNPYFWQTFRNTLDNPIYPCVQESYQKWHDYAQMFGLGSPLGLDLMSEKGGNIPSKEYYNNLYGERGWKSVTVISLGIGQGEILMTPLQLANMYASFANRGFYITPHLVKEVNGKEIETVYNEIDIDAEHFDAIAEGLLLVVEEGTGRRSKIPDIPFGGKTGTVQNPHGEDHSVFAGFAPIDNPQIAIAVVVENAGGGSRYAAPITSLMAEMYINDSIADGRKYFEQQILDADLISPEIVEPIVPIINQVENDVE
ncbi:MAG: penicillin-binding protein 2 [Chitinophagales bacterium]